MCSLLFPQIAASASVDGGGVERVHAMLRMIVDADPSLLAAKNAMGKHGAQSDTFLSYTEYCR